MVFYNNDMKKTLLIAGICVVAIAILYSAKGKEPMPPETFVANSSKPSPTTNPFVDTLKAGGSSYSDPDNRYSFLYPNDYILDTKDPKYIRIYKRGETERPQSEMTDGALMVFESVELNSQTLEQWVDAHIKQMISDGTSESVQPKKAVTVNNYPGFTYELRGLGTTTYVVLQKSPQSFTAVVIAYSVSDPKGKGYQDEVDAVIDTFQLLK